MHAFKQVHMSKKHEQEEDINIGEVYSKTEKFLEEKKQPLLIAIGAVAAIVLGTFYYYSMYLPPLKKEAEQSIFLAQQAFSVDSFELAMYGNEEVIGFEEIVEAYGSTSIGNTAKYYMAVSLMHTKSYEDAIEYYKSYTPEDHVTKALKLGGLGDCYAQLGEFEEAITYYEKAANSYVNDFSTPIYLKKAGIVSEKIGDYKEAVDFYETIKSQYPDSQEGRDIEKYLAHASSFVQ